MRRFSLLGLVLGICLVTPSVFAQDRFLGSISLFPYDFAPKGSASCNGQLLSIAQNQALFALLGTTFGGNGQTTFALPDLRGRVAIGFGQGPGLSPRNLGESAGQESVTLLVQQMPAHNHIAMASSSTGNTVTPAGGYWAVGPRMFLYSAASNLVPMNPGALGNTGGNQPHENRKPFLVLNYVIWLQGIFPSRS